MKSLQSTLDEIGMQAKTNHGRNERNHNPKKSEIPTFYISKILHHENILRNVLFKTKATTFIWIFQHIGRSSKLYEWLFRFGIVESSKNI